MMKLFAKIVNSLEKTPTLLSEVVTSSQLRLFTCSKSTIETLRKKYEICSKLTIKTPERRQ